MLPLIASACVGPSLENPGGSNRRASSGASFDSMPAAAAACVCTVNVSKRCAPGAATPAAGRAPRPDEGGCAVPGAAMAVAARGTRGASDNRKSTV